MKNFKLLFSTLLVLTLFASCESENIQVDEINTETEYVASTYSFYGYLQTLADSYEAEGIEVGVFVDDRGILRIATGVLELEEEEFGDEFVIGFNKLDRSETDLMILCTFADGRQDILSTCGTKDKSCVSRTAINFLTNNGQAPACVGTVRYYRDSNYVSLLAREGTNVSD